MNEIVYKDRRVITTELLARVYETDPSNIRNNFNNHKDYFKEGIHYFQLVGDDLRAFKNHTYDIGVVPKNTAQLYLWTERGANRHCKILDTDKAWEQFDHLEDTYFRVKSIINGLPNSTVPPSVSPSGLANLIRITRRVMLDMGNTPQEVGQMVHGVFEAWNVPLPVSFKERLQLPGQTSLWEQGKLGGDTLCQQ